MKMYGKKLSALLAAMLLLVTTAACGQKADNGNTSEPDALTPVYIGTPATGDHGARMLEAARVAAEKQYFEEEGVDLCGMSLDELLEQPEVFTLSGGRYLIVEA